MKKLLKILAVLIGILIVAVIGAYIWATVSANRVRGQTFAVHAYDLPVPFPVAETDAAGVSERIASSWRPTGPSSVENTWSSRDTCAPSATAPTSAAAR